MPDKPQQQLTPDEQRRAWWILAISTFAFVVSFAAWMMNGVLITFLVENGLYSWTPSEMGWLIGIPVLTGSVFRLPLGVATDKWGGRVVFGLLLLFSTIPMYLVSYCNSYLAVCHRQSGIWILWSQLCGGDCVHVRLVSKASAGHSTWDLRCWQRRCRADHDGRTDSSQLADG